ncbi:FAD-dependent monooxygenase [Glaciecola sp. MH2013]|uniref:FAD-dependent monooxygenase n=1 Tax=Glaciecola sp. MH2013 TaxID=2785524 RepID=UPI00189EC29F|nr:FAD-dependent monooxygenase [Glaciecola sp. MH2013]MBF7072083.1 FAD-dependent monooxygenase [Glaciecola sp. MH2013]
MAGSQQNAKNKDVLSEEASDSSLQHFDIVIAGGGIVGCTAAIAIANHSDFSVAVVEAFDSQDTAKTNPQNDHSIKNAKTTENTEHPSFDARVVALAQESYKQLASFGLKMHKLASCPIKQIHVSDRGHIGQARLDLPEDSAQSMGHVLALADLGKLLMEQVSESKIKYFSPYKISAVSRHRDYSDLSLLANNESVDTKLSLRTKLVIIAEGGNAPSLSFFNLQQQRTDYHQVAVIANVMSQLPHQNRAFERFTEQGPIALLPMCSPNSALSNSADASKLAERHESSRQMSLVWTCDENIAKSISSLDEHAFLAKLQRLFGDKLGRFQASSPRYSYPLCLVRTLPFSTHRVICVGNAAQALHPIAGQGFNLGVRDIAGLLSSIKHVFAEQQSRDPQLSEIPMDPGSFELTQDYKVRRTSDKNAVVMATDSLVRLFSNTYAPTVGGRNMGLIALNHAPTVKDDLVAFAMGKR